MYRQQRDFLNLIYGLVGCAGVSNKIIPYIAVELELVALPFTVVKIYFSPARKILRYPSAEFGCYAQTYLIT
jgi:hypothetical protein